MPEKRTAELISIGLRNCADHEFDIQLGAGAPELVREEAARMFPSTKPPEAAVASGPESPEWSHTAYGVSAVGRQEATEGRQIRGESHLYKPAAGSHVSVGNGVDSPDPCRNLHGLQGDHSMSNSNGIDIIHVRQLRAFAENLYLQADRHREHHNYVVAHALYGHALAAAQRIDNLEHDEHGNALVTRIQKDRQAVYELLRRGDGSPEKAPLEKARKVAQ
jgi:hypothetical protein